MGMGADGNEAQGNGQGISRRRVLATAGLAAAAVPLTAKGASAASLLKTPDTAGAPSPDGLHVQFGADASKEAVVSWLSPVQVRRPKLRIGTPRHGYGDTVPAEERVYTEALTGQTVYTYHAHLEHL